MRMFQVPRGNGLQAVMHGLRDALYVGWALTALGFCGVIALALL